MRSRYGFAMRCKKICASILGLVVLLQEAQFTIGKRHKLACERSDYRKYALKLIKERAFAGLFRDVKNQTKYEASGVAAVRGKYWVVFDNIYSLGLIDDQFAFRGDKNVLVGEPSIDSQFEGIAYVPEDDTFLLLHESMPSASNDPYKPYIAKVKVNKKSTDYEVVQRCEVNFTLTHENKGFEGISYVRTLDGENYLLGLCEGNYCTGGRQGRRPGNGRIIVAQLQTSNGDKDCMWQPVKTIEIPSSAYFQDYAGMSYNHAIGKLAIVSQENASVWIAPFDIDALEFPSEQGQIFPLPRDNDCRVIYCNAEGIHWLDNYRFLIASDKAKATQPYYCMEKDQSIHIFALPPSWKPRGGEQLKVAQAGASGTAVDTSLPSEQQLKLRLGGWGATLHPEEV